MRTFSMLHPLRMRVMTPEWLMAGASVMAAVFILGLGAHPLGSYVLGSSTVTVPLLLWFWVGLMLLIGGLQFTALVCCARREGMEGNCLACPLYPHCRINHYRRSAALAACFVWVALTVSLISGSAPSGLVAATAVVAAGEFLAAATLPRPRWTSLSA